MTIGNEEQKVLQLEQALLRQAETLAREQRQNAESACARIQAESVARLRLREEREILLAKQQAERVQRRSLQAAEARLSGDLDRLRWTLVQSSLSELRMRLRGLTEDLPRYQRWLEDTLAAAALELPPGALLVRLGAEDCERLRPTLAPLAERAAPGREVRWEPLAGDSGGGGMEINLADQTVRIDQTFGGRLTRLELDLAQVIMERLFAASPDLGTLVYG
ncbi:MAG: V-type ATP synthase subunit E [Thiotrichales bacterium]